MQIVVGICLDTWVSLVGGKAVAQVALAAVNDPARIAEVPDDIVAVCAERLVFEVDRVQATPAPVGIATPLELLLTCHDTITPP